MLGLGSDSFPSSLAARSTLPPCPTRNGTQLLSLDSTLSGSWEFGSEAQFHAISLSKISQIFQVSNLLYPAGRLRMSSVPHTPWSNIFPTLVSEPGTHSTKLAKNCTRAKCRFLWILSEIT